MFLCVYLFTHIIQFWMNSFEVPYIPYVSNLNWMWNSISFEIVKMEKKLFKRAFLIQVGLIFLNIIIVLHNCDKIWHYHKIYKFILVSAIFFLFFYYSMSWNQIRNCVPESLKREITQDKIFQFRHQKRKISICTFSCGTN